MSAAVFWRREFTQAYREIYRAKREILDLVAHDPELYRDVLAVFDSIPDKPVYEYNEVTEGGEP